MGVIPYFHHARPSVFLCNSASIFLPSVVSLLSGCCFLRLSENASVLIFPLFCFQDKDDSKLYWFLWTTLSTHPFDASWRSFPTNIKVIFPTLQCWLLLPLWGPIESDPLVLSSSLLDRVSVGCNGDQQSLHPMAVMEAGLEWVRIGIVPSRDWHGSRTGMKYHFRKPGVGQLHPVMVSSRAD